MTMTLTAVPPTRTDEKSDIRQRVDRALQSFMDVKGEDLAEISIALEPFRHALRGFLLDGGKRLRPAFCYWGWRGAGGADDEEGIIRVGAAMELLQAFALIHDDIMDDSDTRRGKPSMHRRFAAFHTEQRLSGCPDSFGRAAAILLGDLCLTWCDQLFDESGLPAERIRSAKPLFHLMHTEVIAGQYLDVLEQSLNTVSLSRAKTVIRYKTAKYTVERPMQIGAKLAGANNTLLAAYSRFALPLGEAFQLRDDLLGVFGDPARTGKPAGDDLREGKHTPLIALAVKRAGATRARELLGLLGDPELTEQGVAAIQSIIVDTGALAEVERLIQNRTDLALRALYAAQLPGDAQQALADLALAATQRTA